MRNLNLISRYASRFLSRTTGITVSAPKVILSTRVKDSARYSHGKIYINPNYNPEKLTYDEMIAHEFFHHVQKKTHPRPKMHGKLKETFLESSAMFFAAAYVAKQDKDSNGKIIRYLNKREHRPKGGNGSILLLFKQKNYDVKATLLALLT